MALRAIVIEIPCHMIGIGRTGEIRLMALITLRIYELVVPIDVTCLTLYGNVGSCQREARRGMIEGRRLPRGCGVTLRAIVIEVSAHVAWIRRLLKLRLMTLIAFRGQACERVVDVARTALSRFVSSRQRKTGGRVIKASSPGKRCHLMTPGAIRRELCHHVVGVLSFLVICPVTSYTRRWSSHILLLRCVGVARLTWHCLVPSEQWEPRLLVFVDHVRRLP